MRQNSSGGLPGFLGREVIPYLRHPNKKGAIRQFRDIIGLTLKYRYLPYQYLNAGLYDAALTDEVMDYLPPALINRYRGRINDAEGCRIVNDKNSFARQMKSGRVSVVEELFVIDRDGAILRPGGEALNRAAAAACLADHGRDIFVKPLSGRFGLGAGVIPPEEIADFLASDPRDVIVQPRLVQHPALAAFHPSSVNTIRIDTFPADGGWVHNAAVLRIGTGGGVVDNGGQRALIVGIDLETGVLKPTARQRSEFGTERVPRHPDTGVAFAGCRIPYWPEVSSLVRAGADVLLEHGLHSIGWDVAMLPDGPCIIEANAGWNVTVMQIGWGGLAESEIARHALSARRPGRKHQPGKDRPLVGLEKRAAPHATAGKSGDD